MNTARTKGWCLCGGSFWARSNPSQLAVDAERIFWSFHDGEGHGLATPRQAARARAKAEPR